MGPSLRLYTCQEPCPCGMSHLCDKKLCGLLMNRSVENKSLLQCQLLLPTVHFSLISLILVGMIEYYLSEIVDKI